MLTRTTPLPFRLKGGVATLTTPFIERVKGSNSPRVTEAGQGWTFSSECIPLRFGGGVLAYGKPLRNLIGGMDHPIENGYCFERTMRERTHRRQWERER